MNKNRLIHALFRFPPDFSLGYRPTTYWGFRTGIGIMVLLKNVIPMVVVERFQIRVLQQNFDNFSHLLGNVIVVMPYTLLLLTVFPLNAAINQLDRHWQKYLASDLRSEQLRFYPKNLPLTEYRYDLYNNRMDIVNKMLYYTGFASFPLSFTLPLPDSLLLMVVGLIIFGLQGFHTGWWLDIQNRVKVKSIFDNNNTS